jgi:hypothetical protein
LLAQFLSFFCSVNNQLKIKNTMKKIIMGLFVVAALSATASYGIGKKAAKKGKVCTKTEAGCCKKGEKAHACCADMAEKKK